MNPEIKTYYDELASTYDENRFGNTYGKYLDRQERAILRKRADDSQVSSALDIACGTGRLLDFASHGIDISPEMISVAHAKYPDKKLSVQSATQTDFEKESLDIVFSFHLIMHLDKETVRQLLIEAHRILKPGGRFIFDAPSVKRRRLIRYKAAGWHGANAYSKAELMQLLGDKWKLLFVDGIAFLPVHRIPARWRNAVIWLDNLLNKSFLKAYSSYLVFTLERK